MTQFYCGKNGPVVEVQQGKLRGFQFDGVYRFLGVPYAKAKRFEMPEVPDKWEGVRNALAYGKICPILQDPTPDDEICVPHRFWPVSENCQNLNIWTDTLDRNAKKPVMVWFHGGGYSTGSSIEHIAYEGDSLAKYDGVVSVSVNHRLNAFGHLDVSSFGERFKNSVNVGIADLVESLRWVKNNIASFGGDPDNVTIFGQSGGGGKVTTLGQTPDCDGLFQKGIIMSGVFNFGMRGEEADPRELTLDILSQFKLGENDIDQLQKVDYRLFILAVNKAVRNMEKKGKFVNWGPHKNYWYLGDPRECGFREEHKKIPTMVGSVMSEFCFGVPFAQNEISDDEARKVIVERFGAENAQKLIDLYRAAYPGKKDIYAIDLDIACRTASLEYVRMMADGGEGVYSYQFAPIFDYDGGRSPWHCSDIPFAFHNSAVIPFCHSIGYRERLEKEMADSFVNFARTGDPNGTVEWKKATKDDVYTTVFDEKTECKKNFDDELMELVSRITPPFVFHFKAKDEEEEGRGWIY